MALPAGGGGGAEPDVAVSDGYVELEVCVAHPQTKINADKTATDQNDRFIIKASL